MKENNIFEKARMNSVIIPAAGFIIASAIVPAVIFTAAYTGAFSSVSETAVNPPAVYDVERREQVVPSVETINEDPVAILELKELKCVKANNSGSEYNVRCIVKNTGESPISVRTVSCMFYNEAGECFQSYLMSDGFELYSSTGTKLACRIECDKPKYVLFFAEWEDTEGRAASVYEVIEP